MESSSCCVGGVGGGGVGVCFFFNDTATTEIYTLSLHDALPIYVTAAMLSGGVALFLFSDHDTNGDTSSNHTSATETTFSGVLLMAGEK